MGGKSRLAKSISEAILAHAKSRKYYLEPFIGGGSVFPLMAPHFDWSVAGDVQEDLVLMWNALIFDGWEPPEVVTEEFWREMRDSKPSPDRAFVGFGASFGGRFFEGIARSGGKISHSSSKRILQFRHTLVTQLTPQRLGQFRHQSYLDWNPIPGTVVYCDPPYAGTKPYTGARSGLLPWDADAFWCRMDEWVDSGCEVYVSEYSAPECWGSIWAIDRKVVIGARNESRVQSTEHLFVRGK